jgi:tetratricopeptide (TPR) repeat protein
MASKKTVVLASILVLLVAVFVLRPQVQAYVAEAGPKAAPAPVPQAPQAPLPGTNSLSNLAVSQGPDGRWQVDFDYFYTGEPRDASVYVYQVVAASTLHTVPTRVLSVAQLAKRGSNHYSGELRNPRVYELAVTTQIQAVFTQTGIPGAPEFARVTLDQQVRWPDPIVAEVEKALAIGKPELVVDKAVDLIDRGQPEDFNTARSMLQALVERSPRTDSAYVELARVAMKTNWTPVGLRDAERLIGSALTISPDSANARILLGYVYAHQRRYREAEPLFAQAAASDPPNLWLWANWGELLAMQGRKEAAVQKYREAVKRPVARNSYDRARTDAYEKLLRLLDERNDAGAMEALLQQRAQEYPGSGCYGTDYARFVVLQRADGARAAQVQRDLPSPQCDKEQGRQVQGLIHYVNWAGAQEPGRAEMLLQARAFLAPSPALFYLLASTDKAVPIAQQLVATGEKVDVQDNQGMDALGYALRNGDVAVARRLLRLGARPDSPQGRERIPAALIPVVNGDPAAIRLLQGAGVDYTRLAFQGTTAVEIARSRGDRKLLELLDPKAGRL